MTWLIAMAAALLALTLLVRAFEASAAFFPSRGEATTPSAVGLAFEAVELTTADGETVHGWWIPHPEPRARVLYLHGNGGNLSMWLPILADLRQRGFVVFAVDYRGYGLSTGRPSEHGLYRDVEAALEWLAARPATDVPTIYWGRSLGGVMAAFAASRRPPDGLILEASFPDGRSVLAGSPLWPLAFLSRYRFPAATWLETVRCPTLVLHGTADSVIGFPLGQRLFAAVKGPKRFVAIEGGDHNDAVPVAPDVYWGAIGEFVASLRGA
jgi:fermentation-respiration switch protein FrsA (DUF1100 family)